MGTGSLALYLAVFGIAAMFAASDPKAYLASVIRDMLLVPVVAVGALFILAFLLHLLWFPGIPLTIIAILSGIFECFQG